MVMIFVLPSKIYGSMTFVLVSFLCGGEKRARGRERELPRITSLTVSQFTGKHQPRHRDTICEERSRRRIVKMRVLGTSSPFKKRTNGSFFMIPCEQIYIRVNQGSKKKKAY